VFPPLVILSKALWRSGVGHVDSGSRLVTENGGFITALRFPWYSAYGLDRNTALLRQLVDMLDNLWFKTEESNLDIYRDRHLYEAFIAHADLTSYVSTELIFHQPRYSCLYLLAYCR
jgi:hypothetical protein